MSIIKHSFLMIRKTFKNYLLLSVTAFLSFAVMFGYLIYTDSEIYNKYKELFSESPNIILSQNTAEQTNDLNLLVKQLEKLPDTHYYYTKSSTAKTSFGAECEVKFLPSYVWGIFESADLNGYTGPAGFKINEEREFSLKPTEAIVSEQVYESIAPDDDGIRRIRLVFTNDAEQKVLKTYEVAGSYSGDSVKFSDPETSLSTDPVYVNMASVNESDCVIDNIALTIYTERNEFVIEQIKSLGLACEEIYSAQNTAVAEKLTATTNKYIIAAVLFILLGINLYSSFTNALNDRKFEIGVKRALGASKMHIMLQFVVEGLAVMLANIILSVCAVICVMNIYKFIEEFIFGNVYVITMNFESVLLYVIFAFFLTLTFSLLFAYQCTKVEIVKYLKEEL